MATRPRKSTRTRGTSRRAKRAGRRRPREPAWTRLSDAELLNKKFSELRLSLKGSRVEKHLRDIRSMLDTSPDAIDRAELERMIADRGLEAIWKKAQELSGS